MAMNNENVTERVKMKNGGRPRWKRPMTVTALLIILAFTVSAAVTGTIKQMEEEKAFVFSISGRPYAEKSYIWRREEKNGDKKNAAEQSRAAYKEERDSLYGYFENGNESFEAYSPEEIRGMFFHNFSTYSTIREQGEKDVLTGLYNRNRYEADIPGLGRGFWKSLICIYMDADGLHELNNARGHGAEYRKDVSSMGDMIKSAEKKMYKMKREYYEQGPHDRRKRPGRY